MSVLDSIIEGVKEDLEARKLSHAQIMEAVEKADPVRADLSAFSKNSLSLIAEVKRSSPSKGSLALISNPAELASHYEQGGATAISVLTERRRFGGSLEDLDAVRRAVDLPILRKDFMVDQYQFYEARAHGADLVLLIVAALSKNQLADYLALTRELGMHAIVEVHTHSELEIALDNPCEMVGINSRNLKTLDVDPVAFKELLPLLPSHLIRIAESGISTPEDVKFAMDSGANAILVGEALVRAGDPVFAVRGLLGEL
ncbi:MAG: indole-3-glycerol phosphate synthase TrpC [Candidatus Planktophila sp.]